MREVRRPGILRRLLQQVIVVVGAAGLTALFFLALPLIQAIAAQGQPDVLVRSVNAAELPPPPPAIEEEPPEEEEPEEEPPELMEEAPPLDLSQLELALNPGGFSEGWLGGDFAVDLDNVVGGAADVDALFSIADLDQKPRVIYQPGPNLTAKLRRQAPGTVYILFIVDQDGRVVDPKVQSATDPIFELPALSAVKKWKFEPGKRSGKPVRFRMRVPITFPE